MPELPEVETIRRQLAPSVEGREITELEILDPTWTAPQDPAAVESAVSGHRITSLSRRGKYLLCELADGPTLVLHLRMTGNLVLDPAPGQAQPRLGDPRLGDGTSGARRHLRARIGLDHGGELLFTDPRRFGRGIVLDRDAIDPFFAERLGSEPFSSEFTAESLGESSRNRTAPLKSFLLDQSVVAGIGNIYADEALFRAGLHPLSPAGSTRPEHHEALRRSILEALEAGIANGGASIDDYRDARGESGKMQDEFLVHRREGEACPRCGEAVRRIVVSGRSTYFCARCQRRLRRKPRSRR